MAAPVKSVDEFLSLVRRSGLVEEPRLAPVVEPWLGEVGLPPEAMLEALMASGLLTRWQIDQLLKGKYKGFMLGKYRLLKLLGSGGMSTVYLGEHATLRSKAAVKVLPVKKVAQRSFLARFEQEARMAARLNHPNIVRTFDLDTAGAIHYIAMEYIEGSDLHTKVKREGRLPVREAADFIRQAAEGLDYAHAEGLVHRDIKPANLMLDTRGTIKILDLGLALAVSGDDGDDSLTLEHDEKVLGTADYLAPEQATDSHTADRRSDIYALGCTLHYLLVGAAPFASGKAAARMHAHLHKPPPNLLERRPDVPIAIADLYFRMLAKQPDARPQSAREVADSLAAWLASTDPSAAGGRSAGTRRPLPRRHVPPGPGSSISGIARGGPGSSVIVTRSKAPDSADQPRAGAAQPRPATSSPGAAPAPHPPAGPATRSRWWAGDVAGVPLGIWILIGVGGVVAVLLAVLVWQRSSG